MSLRLIEAIVPQRTEEEVEAILKDLAYVDYWKSAINDELDLIRVFVDIGHSEAVLDALDQRFSYLKDYRLMLLPVEATLPRLPTPEQEAKAKEESEPGDESRQKEKENTQRASREELYADIEANYRITRQFLTLIVLSAIVAGIGLIRDNAAAIIGAMVIAPLLGPNVALSLATTLGEVSLAVKSLRSLAAGSALAFAFAVAGGIFVDVDPSLPEIHARTVIGDLDLLLALAAGAAAALSFSTGAPSALIGVMVAVALLPPLVTSGMLLGSGHFAPAASAALLFFANVVCVNLAGVVTLAMQGIRPQSYWEAKKAAHARKVAMGIWLTALLLLLVVLYLYFQR
ncbi:MAG: TIGR00341 family protein [Deltaproteobacteria bacterium]|nr:TIGR00341 family protein [Deltaproteobacteria bacterium]